MIKFKLAMECRSDGICTCKLNESEINRIVVYMYNKI